MKVLFNGTHIHKGLLKVRFDLYIDDPASKTYAQQYVQVATEDIPKNCFDRNGDIIQNKYDTWWVVVPKIWRLNPALCSFVVVPEIFLKEDLAEYVARLFNPDSVATLDNALVQPKSADLVSPYMRTKLPFTDKRVSTQDFESLIAETNLKLASLSIDLAGGGEARELEPQTIDVGPACTDRAGMSGSNTTLIAEENPANATGTIDTVEIWASPDSLLNLLNTEVATFENVGSNNFTSRDSEFIGTVTRGSKQTYSNLNMDVTSGDYIGIFFSDGGIERDVGGAGGYWYLDGDYIPCTSQTFSFATPRTISLYGTGEERTIGKTAHMADKMVTAGAI